VAKLALAKFCAPPPMVAQLPTKITLLNPPLIVPELFE
jgi:hypothetical protein